MSTSSPKNLGPSNVESLSDFGEALKFLEFEKQGRITVRDLAKKLDMSKSTVQRTMNGERLPKSLDELEKLLTYVGPPGDDILEWEAAWRRLAPEHLNKRTQTRRHSKETAAARERREHARRVAHKYSVLVRLATETKMKEEISRAIAQARQKERKAAEAAAARRYIRPSVMQSPVLNQSRLSNIERVQFRNRVYWSELVPNFRVIHSGTTLKPALDSHIAELLKDHRLAEDGLDLEVCGFIGPTISVRQLLRRIGVLLPDVTIVAALVEFGWERSSIRLEALTVVQQNQLLQRFAGGVPLGNL